MAAFANTAGEQIRWMRTTEYMPTEEELAQEEKEEPIMMKNAERWDSFLALVQAIHVPWPQGEADSTEYREGRAVEAFNQGCQRPQGAEAHADELGATHRRLHRPAPDGDARRPGPPLV
eukprot:4029447-Prymnesium_polylepis.1